MANIYWALAAYDLIYIYYFIWSSPEPQVAQLISSFYKRERWRLEKGR